MKYPGSKSRLAKSLLPIILAKAENAERWVEPFFGGGGMAQHAPHTLRRFGYEINPFVVAMFDHAIKGGLFPENITEEEYSELKRQATLVVRERPDWLIGFAGIGCSFAGKWFGGYARGAGRNYCAESKRNIERQAPRLAGFTLHNASYIRADIQPGDIVYCDPPYAGATGYGFKFDSDAFWRVARGWSNKGAHVFVSEYNAPAEWRSVWEKQVASSLDLNTGSKRATEKLFVPI